MHLLLLTFYMEPPSSISLDQVNNADPLSDDPLLYPFQTDSFIIVSRSSENDIGEGYSVCLYSARTGLTYIGQSGSIYS